MRSHPISAIALVACMTIGIVPPCNAQGRDTVPARLARSVVAVIRAPTVIAIGDTARLAPSFGAIRATVDSLALTLQAFGRPIQQIVDQAHHAVHYVSSDLVLGYIIIVPGRRPVVVHGPMNPDSLRSRVLAYLRINRELDTGSR